MPTKDTFAEASPMPAGQESVAGGEAVIHTIPDKFYGAALKAKLVSPEERNVPAAASIPAQGGKRHTGMVAGIIVLLLLLGGVGGGFVYFNRQLLFPQLSAPAQEPSPEPPRPPAPPPPPAAPTNLSATATNPNLVQLNWTDTSDNEAGFRVERREPTTAYVAVTSLPPNSNAFQDRSVEAERTYLYRIISLNAGGESPTSNEASADTPALPPPPPEQPKLPPAGLDSDSDGLTDLEEPLYGTSPTDPDADKDTFLDGNEVFHLYNPAGKQGVKLLESGLVKEFKSPVGWTVLVPTSWQTEIDAEGLRARIRTGHGEFFMIAVEPNPENQSILDWYLTRNPGVLSSDTVMIETKSGIPGLVGKNPLVTYFSWKSAVLVFTYDLNGQTFVNFRTTYEMMKNSLQLAPEPVLPSAPSAPEATPESALPPVVPEGNMPEPENAAEQGTALPPPGV